MKATSERLKSQREKLGISLVEVSIATKITPRSLQAIEAGDLEHLPAKTFLRGFVKSYATFLKMDVEDVLRTFQEEMAALEAPATPPPSGTESPEPVVEPTPVKAHEPKPRTPIVSDGMTAYKKVGIGIGIATLLTVIVIAYRQVAKYERESQVSPPPEAVAKIESTDDSADEMPGAVEPDGDSGQVPADNAATTTPEKPVEDKAAETKVAEVRAAETKPEEPKPAAKPAPSNQPAEKPAENRSTEPKPVAAKPEEKPAAAEAKPAEVKATKVVEAKPPETKTEAKKEEKTEAKPTAPKAEDVKPAETKAKEQKTTEAKAEEPKKSEKKAMQEVIIEALDKVSVTFRIGDGQAQTVNLMPDQVHTIKAAGTIAMELSDGGAVNLIHNGRDVGVPGDLGKPKKIKLP